MDAVAIETIDRDGREYTIEIHADLDGQNPFEAFDNASTLVINGGREYIDAEHGELSDQVLAALKTGYSNAAIARWLRLKGATGIHLVARGGNYGTIRTRSMDIAERDTDHSINTWSGEGSIYRTDGFAFLAPGVAEREGIPEPDRFVAGEVSEYAAWAEGAVHGWVTLDPNGNDIESCWGYYGYDHAASGLMEAAIESIDQRERSLADQANAAGAGFVGVI